MLSLSSVNLSYAAQDVLHGISLEVMRGEFLSIVGGSGKSSLLKVMGGIEPPQTGHVRYDSVDIYHVNDRKYSEMQQSSGFLFQDAALLA
ncbi:MAG TPA: ATP-binding cassette domain-containing protein, partial [Spirochaetota bacterium]|nr:ATP-binding cassette domain-containing protein [Spirochaetota bacterium]